MEKVAIVILNWNGLSMLERYLPSVLQYSRDEATVYVADNASTDGSLEMLKKHFPEVKLVPLERNWGFAEGYNKALRQIEAKYYLLLNSDIEVTHHWLTPLVEFMDVHQDVAACQPKLLSIFDKDRFEYAGASGDTSTDTATLSVVGVSLRQWRKTMASMTIRQTASGRQVPH